MQIYVWNEPLLKIITASHQLISSMIYPVGETNGTEMIYIYMIWENIVAKIQTFILRVNLCQQLTKLSS